MAEQSTPSPPNIGGNGFIWIALVAATTLFLPREVPLEGSRPPTGQQVIVEPIDLQDIDARLWQDPFAAVNDALTKSPDLKPNACNPTPLNGEPLAEAKNHCRAPEPKPGTRILVMSVDVSPNSDSDEFRRRARYAALAGLSAEGFVPANEEHIGFYWPEALHPKDPKEPKDPKGTSDITMPKYIPFEEFDSKTNPNHHALLLWYDESVLRDTPIKQFSSLLCESFGKSLSKVAVLGPQTSTSLLKMAREAKGTKDPVQGEAKGATDPPQPEVKPAKDWLQPHCPDLNLKFYVYSATTDDATLIPDDRASCSRDTCLQEFFRKRGIGLYRMIATDEALAHAMTRELGLRGVGKPEDHGDIALVSEWDTVYGRALPESMARCLGEQEQCSSSAHPLADKTWLHPFKYLRGLDGQTPGAPSGDGTNRSTDKRAKPDNETKSDTKARPDTKTRDRAEGQSQFDYVRRLGEEMQQLDTELRRKNSRGIKAIGVLGSDLYDKLLILQALRPLFTEAFFFTTDLDGLLLHPMAQTPTRNLLVASGFGLRLRSEIQGEIPPFRDVYETASFLATRVAVRSESEPPPAWSIRPLVFEIGSSHAFQFPARNASTPVVFDEMRQDHDQCHENLLECADAQPVASEMFPYLSMSSAILISIVGLSMILISRTARRRVGEGIDKFMRDSKNRWLIAAWVVAALVALCAVIFALAAAMYALWPVIATGLTANGEPITLVEGISIWPTIFFRLAAFALCVWLNFRASRLLQDNMNEIKAELKLNDMWSIAKQKQKEAVDSDKPWAGLSSFFWWPDVDKTQDGTPGAQDALLFWRKYIHQGRRTARFLRILTGVVTMFMLAVAITGVFGNQAPPTRGNLSYDAYQWVATLLFIATLFLIFFVADATLLCWSVIRSFRIETVVWPAATVTEFSRRLVLPERVLENWLDLLFVSRRTACITGLIYYPFLILGLLVLSRNRVFADFAPSIAMVLVIGLSVLILMGCAVALHWSAETSRDQARTRLNDEIVKALSLEDEGRLANQLQMMLRRVDGLRDGAFSPFSQQPLVRAILLPLGGFGGSTLLEYLSASGLIG
jgi:hypothetical protein